MSESSTRKTAHRSATALLLAGLCLVGCKPTAPEAESDRLVFENQSPDVAYVGQEACRQCHFEKFSTYVHTGMGRSLYPMSAEEAVEDFTEHNEFVVLPAGLHYRMERRGDKFYQRQFLVDSQGREVAVDEHELVYVIGSNHHSRSYAIMIDDKMFQAPACWYPQAQRWDLCPGYEFKNDHFGRELTMNCLHCHNGRMETVEGERNEFKKPIPHGIGCERCHGPGALHVERWTSGEDTPTGQADLTIVHPRRLPKQERIEVCFQCHLGDARSTERVGRPGRDTMSYRPGQRITETTIPFRYQVPTQHDFGLSAQADRMILSRCYTESDGKLECMTCHNPHITVYHEERPPDLFRQKCVGCHAVEQCTASAEERQRTVGLADDCVACHMRKAEPDDQRYTEFTDHWIRRDIDIEERDRRENYAVEPVFPQHYASLPKGEQSFYRGRAISLLARDAPESARPPMWDEAERAFEKAIADGYDTVDSWFFLGTTRRYMGKRAKAVEAFERAVEHDPAHHDAAYALGQMLLARGELQRALGIFEGMLERDPGDPMALAEIGRTFMALGRKEEAMASYKRALSEEPWQSPLHHSVAMFLASENRFDEAAEEAMLAARFNPDDPEVWEFLERVMRAAGRPEEAERAKRFYEHLKTIPKMDETGPTMTRLDALGVHVAGM